MLSPIMLIKLTHKFHLVDVDHDGRITGADYARLARDAAHGLGVDPSSMAFELLQSKWTKHWADTVKDAKSASSDELTLGEYLNAEDVGLRDLARHREEHARMTRIMGNAMDPEGTGRITIQSYKAVFRAYRLSDAQVEAAFAIMVPGRDYMTRAEFGRFADQFFAGDDPTAPGNNFFGVPVWWSSE
jgi:hypothetical protein